MKIEIYSPSCCSKVVLLYFDKIRYFEKCVFVQTIEVNGHQKCLVTNILSTLEHLSLKKVSQVWDNMNDDRTIPLRFNLSMQNTQQLTLI